MPRLGGPRSSNGGPSTNRDLGPGATLQHDGSNYARTVTIAQVPLLISFVSVFLFIITANATTAEPWSWTLSRCWDPFKTPHRWHHPSKRCMRASRNKRADAVCPMLPDCPDRPTSFTSFRVSRRSPRTFPKTNCAWPANTRLRKQAKNVRFAMCQVSQRLLPMKRLTVKGKST